MNEKKEAGIKLRLNKVDKVILVGLIILMLVLAVLSVMSRFGLILIKGSLYTLGAFASLAILLGWGCYALVRIFKKKSTRMIMGTLAAVVMFLLLTVGVSLISVFSSISIPVEFDTIVNGDKKVVILKGYDLDEARVALRKEERLKNDPEADPEDTAEDYGYHYYAYPKVMGIFYRADADVEGEIYVGQASQAQLMIEWLDENTAHLFLENPEIGDGGDFYLRY